MGQDKVLEDGTKANHRFRAWINGFFIEFSTVEIHRFSKPSAQEKYGIGGEYLNLDACFRKEYERTNTDPKYCRFVQKEYRSSKESILSFINRTCGTKYNDVEFKEIV